MWMSSGAMMGFVSRPGRAALGWFWVWLGLACGRTSSPYPKVENSLPVSRARQHVFLLILYRDYETDTVEFAPSEK
jgi:hypothetical protein